MHVAFRERDVILHIETVRESADEQSPGAEGRNFLTSVYPVEILIDSTVMEMARPIIAGAFCAPAASRLLFRSVFGHILHALCRAQSL